MKPALLVIDIQNAWLDGHQGLRESVEKRAKVINEAIEIFRGKRLPIIVVYHEDKKDGPRPGTKAFEFSPTINIQDADTKVTKNYPNAFNKTDLENILHKKGCDTVIITGLSAVGCALATYHGAIDLDLNPYFVRDGVAADTEEHVRFAEDICDTLSVREFDRALR